MNKAELKALARYGVSRKIAVLEKELAELYDEFPDLFVSKPPFILLAAQPRETPRELPIDLGAPDEDVAPPKRRPLSPEQRAAAAERARRMREIKLSGAPTLIDRVLAHLLTQGPSRAKAIAEAIGNSTSGVSATLRQLKARGLTSSVDAVWSATPKAVAAAKAKARETTSGAKRRAVNGAAGRPTVPASLPH